MDAVEVVEVHEVRRERIGEQLGRDIDQEVRRPAARGGAAVGPAGINLDPVVNSEGIATRQTRIIQRIAQFPQIIRIVRCLTPSAGGIDSDVIDRQVPVNVASARFIRVELEHVITRVSDRHRLEILNLQVDIPVISQVIQRKRSSTGVVTLFDGLITRGLNRQERIEYTGARWVIVND